VRDAPFVTIPNITLLDDALEDWPALKKEHEWDGLLLGNGASIAVSQKFSYASLLGYAQLSPEAHNVFATLDTTNFELVLDALRVSARVCESVGHGPDDAEDLHDEVRKSLFGAVNDVHPEHHEVSGARLKAFADCMLQYSVTFTTNYDLLPYWAIMEGLVGVKDYFWNADCTFDALDTELWGGSAILYLHGGMHLYQDAVTGVTGKWKGLRLLDVAATRHRTRSPLVVSEDKLRSIRRSDFLSFAYRELAEFSQPLVIFGHGLGQSDQHIIGPSTRTRTGRSRMASARLRDWMSSEESSSSTRSYESRRAS